MRSKLSSNMFPHTELTQCRQCNKSFAIFVLEKSKLYLFWKDMLSHNPLSMKKELYRKASRKNSNLVSARNLWKIPKKENNPAIFCVLFYCVINGELWIQLCGLQSPWPHHIYFSRSSSHPRVNYSFSVAQIVTVILIYVGWSVYIDFIFKFDVLFINCWCVGLSFTRHCSIIYNAYNTNYL